MERVFLNAQTPLVTAVADWLASQMRMTPGGVKSLDHLMVVVPTKQAGRRLRLALAERSGNGCLPPLLRLPAQAVVPAREPGLPLATPAESLGLLCRVLLALDLAGFPQLFPEKGRPLKKTFAWALGVARQLHDLWGLLEENALDMRDVAARIEPLLAGEDLDVEVDRWRDLARVEALFFDALVRLGRTPGPVARKQAVAAPKIPDGVEAVVLPALADALPALYAALEGLGGQVALTVLIHAPPEWSARFDAWGRPEPGQWAGPGAPLLPLADGQIVLASTAAEQARRVAQRFAAVPADREPPALGMADDTLFNELQAAFLSRDRLLHNPARYPLAASSLGRLIQQIEQLCQAPRYPFLAAFLRQADVARWLETTLSLPADDYAAILSALDELQNAHLPQTFEDACRFCKEAQARAAAGAAGPEEGGKWERLGRALDAVGALLEPKGRAHLVHLSEVLQALFAARVLQERAPGDRELAAAAEAALEVFEAMASPLLSEALDDSERALLFSTLVAGACYQLEPENEEALLTEGWLELPWSPARELVITGFNEGSVPEAVVGHAFLPDRLRQGLGLMSNERRTARDTYLLHALLASRPQGAVRLYLERVSDTHDARKPSRLLFLCDDATLAARAVKLFSSAERAAAGHYRTLPAAWRLNLPVPQEAPTRLSVTGLSSYLECPFTFYLKHVLKMEPCDDRVAELDPRAFGNLCHEALDGFGKSALKDSAEAAEIAGFLEGELWRRVHAQYGAALSAVLHLQAAAACKRLAFFAARQALLRAEGWQIAETEQSLVLREQGLTILGRADRIDHHPATGAWRILDYKTWDRPGKRSGASRFLSSAPSDVAAAVQRGLVPFEFEGKRQVWTDLQLPLYLLMLEAAGRTPVGAAVECGYFTLGEAEPETLCTTWDFAPLKDSAAACIRCVAGRVKAGIYWPPSTKEVWARGYDSLFMESPEKSVRPGWIRDQEARLAREGVLCGS